MAVRNRILFAGLAVCLAYAAPAAHAQGDPLPELDALVDESRDARSGVALARTQMDDGELTAAAATLERVLMNDPQADAALLLHASLLCRLDDAAGARAELAEMRTLAISDQAWSEVTAACGSMPRPARRVQP